MNLKNVEKIKEASQQIQADFAKLNNGPFAWYIDQLVLHSQALMTYAPFQIGERVKIAVPPSCHGGWKGSENTLGYGKEGIVQDVGYDEHGFYFEWVPDVETYWSEQEQKYLSTASIHNYRLRPKHLARV